jgi:surface protein
MEVRVAAQRCQGHRIGWSLNVLVVYFVAIAAVHAMGGPGDVDDDGGAGDNYDTYTSSYAAYDDDDDTPFDAASDELQSRVREWLSNKDVAREKHGNISEWDVSRVTSFKKLFLGASHFNADLSKWNTSNIVDMTNMFNGAHRFNGDVSSWDVSKVVAMTKTFAQANVFNSDLSTWEVSNVVELDEMFYYAANFSCNLSAWDVSSVSSMYGMFYGSNFNGDISTWDVSNVGGERMGSLFYNDEKFNGNLSAWDVSKVTDMTFMFGSAVSFTGDVSAWDVSNVVRTSNMFDGAYSFNGNLSAWNLSNLVDMSSMFSYADAFDGDLSRWDVSKVVDMNGLFNSAQSFNGNLTAWGVSKVVDMSNMFNGAHRFNGDISSWNVTNLEDMRRMFQEARSFNHDIGSWRFPSSGVNVLEAFQNISDVYEFKSKCLWDKPGITTDPNTGSTRSSVGRFYCNADKRLLMDGEMCLSQPEEPAETCGTTMHGGGSCKTRCCDVFAPKACKGCGFNGVCFVPPTINKLTWDPGLPPSFPTKMTRGQSQRFSWDVRNLTLKQMLVGNRIPLNDVTFELKWLNSSQSAYNHLQVGDNPEVGMKWQPEEGFGIDCVSGEIFAAPEQHRDYKMTAG